MIIHLKIEHSTDTTLFVTPEYSIEVAAIDDTAFAKVTDCLRRCSADMIKALADAAERVDAQPAAVLELPHA